MERRGAAEVLATDVIDPRGWDWPAGSEEATLAAIAERKAGGSGFELARRALGSSVERIELSVYDLDPEVLGEFDVVYVGSLLLHLRDPVRALRRVRSVCAGTFVLCDAIDPLTSLLRHRPVASLDGVGRPWWWKPNVAGLVRMVSAAGFQPTGPARRVRMPAGPGHPPAGRDPRLLLSRAGREHIARARRGEPHVALAATPRL
jgi:tRNA (mo5U34)-methyltransferase